MSFSFDADHDKMIHMFVKSVINNGGAFKSKGQHYAMFVKGHSRSDSELLLSNYGVKCDAGQKVVTVGASNRWAEYGSRNIIPMLWMAVIDEHGVVAHYKIKGKGNLRDGWAPDATKTELLYTRETTPVRAEWLDEEKAADPFINEEAMIMRKLTGLPEGRQVIRAKVLKITYDYDSYDGYNTTETVKVLMLTESGLMLKGTLPKAIRDAERNDIIEFTAAIQMHPTSLDFGFTKRPAKASFIEKVERKEATEEYDDYADYA